MSASNLSFLQEIVSTLKTMWKTCIKLSKRVIAVETIQVEQSQKVKEIEQQTEEIVRQHLQVIKQVSQISLLQSDIAKQVIAQHNETEALMKGLGLTKDLSYYSFNLHNEEGH